MLSIRDLSVGVDKKTILRHLNLEVRAGEVHAVMGPNGSGKSTLSQALAGHPAYTVTDGQVTYLGRDLLAMPAEERARAGVFLAFQYPIEIAGVSNAAFLKAALNEILQMLVLEPRLAILDETDSGLDIDALKVVAAGVNSQRAPDRSCVLVTHYQRLLEYVVPDFVHVLMRGRIARSGDRTLALELERRGYDFIAAEAA